jgi:hypothetical protein
MPQYPRKDLILWITIAVCCTWWSVVSPTATPTGTRFADLAELERMTGEPVRSEIGERRYRLLPARICSRLATPFASPNNSQASETGSGAESLKKTAAYQPVMRGMRFEKEWLPWSQGTEAGPGGQGAAWPPLPGSPQEPTIIIRWCLSVTRLVKDQAR